jgi:hypothetical protein
MSDISNPIHPVHGVPVPLTLKCTVSGKIVKYTAPEYIKAKIAEAGSLEKLLATYVSKGAHKRVAEGAKPSSTPPVVKTSTRTWKGSEIIKDPKDSKVQPASAPTTPTNDPTVEVVFILHDGTECSVSAPRSLMSQSLEQGDVIDFRPKHKDVALQE